MEMTGTIIRGSYHPVLVLLSVVLAVAAAIT